MSRIDVVPYENGWKVIEDGADTGEIYETEERAAEAARARAGGAETEVHMQDRGNDTPA